MIKHSFSDFSYAVNTESAKKGHKEVLVCFIYNGTEVLKKVYIPEGPGVSYIFEARKIIDQQIKSGELSAYSHRFVRRNKAKRIQPKKVVAAVNAGKPAPTAPTKPSGSSKKWVIITAAIAALVVVGATLTTYFATRNTNPSGPVVDDQYDVVFDTSDSYVKYEGASTVKAKEAYTCKISIEDTRSNTFEVNKENLTVYAGKNKLLYSTDYDLTYKEEGTSESGKNWLELSVHEKKIDGTLFISAKSIECSSLSGEGAFVFDSSSQTITGLKLKAGQSKASITEINIPDTIGGKEVKSINSGLLNGCSSLRKITIPFVGLEKEVTIDADIEYQKKHLFGAIFGDTAFKNAETPTYQDYWYTDQETGKDTHVLPESSIPNTIREITVTHYNKVTYIDSDDVSITKTSIPMGAFSNCVNITDVTVSDTSSAEVSIDRSAFSGCRALRTFTYNGNTTNQITSLTVGENAFNGCGVLSSFDYTPVKTIQKGAFSNCEGMVSVYLPSSVETIEEGAFGNYAGLIKCQPETDQSGWAPGWVDQITPVIYGLTDKDAAPITLTDSEGTDFSCLITETTVDSSSNVKEKSIYIVQYLGDYNNSPITIPDKLNYNGDDIYVKYIGSEAFMDFNLTPTIDVTCTKLISVGPEAFKKCYELESIDFEDSNSSLISVGCNAFENCPKLTTIKGLSSVTTLGDYAFYDCPKLLGDETSKFNLSNVTSVGASAFENDEALTSVTLHKDATDGKGVTFGSYAFNKCSKLATVEYNAVANESGKYTIPTYCFCRTALNPVKVPACTTDIEDAAYAYCESATQITFEGEDDTKDQNLVETIGNSAFLRCKNVNSEVILPSSLKTIMSSAFQDCYRLTGIYCKSSQITEIPDSVCYGDSNLKYFVYGSGAKINNIDRFAFAQDQLLSYVGEYTEGSSGSRKSDNVMAPELAHIGDRAFINCIGLGQWGSLGGTQYTPEIHITWPTNTEDQHGFVMGEQVFYGWYDYGTSTTNLLKVDDGWFNNAKNKIMWDTPWDVTSSGGYYKYLQTSSGTIGDLYIKRVTD